MSGLLLRTRCGIGDVLAALPIAYALVEHGYEVNIEPEKTAHGKYANLVNELPVLPLLDAKPPYDNIIDLTQNWNWADPRALAEIHLEKFGIYEYSTPRTAMLQTPGRYKDLPAEYVVICGSGVSFAEAKRMTIAQMSAVREAGRRIGFRTVLVGAEAGENAPVDIDLRGQTTIGELCSIVAHARAVVSVDTGILHIAGAYNTPLIALMPHATVGGQLAQYMPKIIICASTAAQVNSSAIEAAVVRIVRCAREKWCVVGPVRQPCGIHETGRIMAEATGVDYVPFEAHDGGLCVAEYHIADIEPLHKYCKPETTVLSLHRPDGIVIDQWAGSIFRSREAYRKYSNISRQATYAPLHSAYLRPTPDTRTPGPLRLVWHGLVHTHKGLKQIVDAWRIARQRVPDIELTLMGSIAAWWHDPEFNAWLSELSDPGLTVKTKLGGRTREELHEEFLQADIHIAFDSIDKEQSAVIPTVLGYGAPVIISGSTAFDDTRGWCITSTREGLAETILKLASDEQVYNNYAKRAWLGAQYRQPELIARQYRAAIIQAQL